MIKIIALSWFIAYFEPLQGVIDNLANIFYVKSSRNVRDLINLIHTSLGCMKCLSFWISLGVTLDFFQAALTSLIAYTIHLCLHKLR
jgi:hypothetical protein